MFQNGFPGFMFGGMGGEDDEESYQQQAQGKQKKEAKDIENKKFYEILGVENKAEKAEITKAFRKACVKGDYRHPDRGGDANKFKELNEAYEVLSNPEKRDVYDRFGVDGLKEGGQGGGDPFDISSFFGGGGKKKDKGPVKAKAKLRELQVQLEDVFNGTTQVLKHTRKRTCEACGGEGGKNVKDCAPCKGKGIIEKMVMLGPGMYTHSQQYCPECKGEGKKCDKKDQCKSCKGQKIVDNEKELDITIERGVPHEHDYNLSGEGDEAPGIMAGDLFVRIMIKKHKIFTRKGADLFINKKITLLEALTGFNFEISHLDGGKFTIATLPGEVISHEQVKCVKGKGMPYFKDNMSFGHLYIQFEVEFPQKGQLKPDAIKQLEKILPGSNENKKQLKKGEFEVLTDFVESDQNPSEQGGTMRDEDEQQYQRGGKRGQGAQQVQCQQQ